MRVGVIPAKIASPALGCQGDCSDCTCELEASVRPESVGARDVVGREGAFIRPGAETG